MGEKGGRSQGNQGFPGSSADKESNCTAGDPGSIPGSGSSPGEGIGYPLQYSRASVVAQMVKNPPECWRPRFDPWLGKIPWRRAYQPTILFLPRESAWTPVHRVTKSRTWLSNLVQSTESENPAERDRGRPQAGKQAETEDAESPASVSTFTNFCYKVRIAWENVLMLTGPLCRVFLGCMVLWVLWAFRWKPHAIWSELLSPPHSSQNWTQWLQN